MVKQCCAGVSLYFHWDVTANRNQQFSKSVLVFNLHKAVQIQQQKILFANLKWGLREHLVQQWLHHHYTVLLNDLLCKYLTTTHPSFTGRSHSVSLLDHFKGGQAATDLQSSKITQFFTRKFIRQHLKEIYQMISFYVPLIFHINYIWSIHLKLL